MKSYDYLLKNLTRDVLGVLVGNRDCSEASFNREMFRLYGYT